MTSNTLSENEGHDIPSHILKTIFGLHASGSVIPDPSGQLAELIVYITSTRVDLYSNQILLDP